MTEGGEKPEIVSGHIAHVSRLLKPISEMVDQGMVQAVVVLVVAGEGNTSTLHQENLGNVWVCNAILKSAAEKNDSQLLANLIVNNQIAAQQRAMADMSAQQQTRAAMNQIQGRAGNGRIIQ